MDLKIGSGVVEIVLEPMERLASCRINSRIELSLADIQTVSTQRPDGHWRELRAPGTYFPGLIKAGTYYSELGRAFWHVQRDQPCLCIDLEAGYYKRVVLGSDLAQDWCSQIQAVLPVHS